MPSHFRVDTNELDQISIRLKGLIEFVDENLSVLDEKIKSLPSVWTGKAAFAASDAHKRWDAGASDLREGLYKMRTAAVKANEQYTSAVAANIKMLGRG